MHLVPLFVAIVFWWIESSLCNKTEKFPTNVSSSYHVVNINDTNVTLLCDDVPAPSNITIRKDDGRVLNQITGYGLYYIIDDIRCEDSGNYFCDINSNNSNTSRGLELAIVSCPPRLCQEEESNKTLDVVLYSKVSFHICVLVPVPNTSIQLIIFYKDQWLKKTNCEYGVCVDWSQDNISIFRFTIKITIVNITEEELVEFHLKIGTNYNFRDNYINYTRLIKLNVTSTVGTTRNNTTATTVRTTVTVDKQNSTPITPILRNSLIAVSIFIIILTVSFLSRFRKVRHYVGRLRLALTLLVESLLDNITGNKDEDGNNPEPTKGPTVIELNSGEEAPGKTKDTDYYKSDDGLIYLELAQVAPRPIADSRGSAKDTTCQVDDVVEYVTLDFTKTGQTEIVEEDEHVYNNVFDTQNNVLSQL